MTQDQDCHQGPLPQDLGQVGRTWNLCLWRRPSECLLSQSHHPQDEHSYFQHSEATRPPSSRSARGVRTLLEATLAPEMLTVQKYIMDIMMDMNENLLIMKDIKEQLAVMNETLVGVKNALQKK